MKSTPIWAAYLAAPLVLLALTYPVIVKSESPGVLIAFLVVCGLVCAVTLHGYVVLKKWLTSKR